MYECKRCGLTSKYKENIIRHIKKNTCKSKDKTEYTQEELLEHLIGSEFETFDCDQCGAVFKTCSGLRKHIPKCIGINTTTNTNNGDQNIIGDHNTMQNTNNTTNNINIHITLNNFGEENTDYITRDDIERCITDRDIEYLITRIHLDPDHPENHNIKLQNKRAGLVKIYNKNVWKTKYISDKEDNILFEMYERLMNCISDIVNLPYFEKYDNDLEWKENYDYMTAMELFEEYYKIKDLLCLLQKHKKYKTS